MSTCTKVRASLKQKVEENNPYIHGVRDAIHKIT